MPHRSLTKRSLVLTAILLIGIIACIAPAAAADKLAYIKVTSVPSGAQACLDQSTCSITPTTFSVTPISYHIVTFYKDGYQTFTTQPVYASSANITTTLLVNLALKPSPSLTGTLDIDSRPTDAAIWLDNLYYGTSPVMIGSLSAGAHTLYQESRGLMITPNR